MLNSMNDFLHFIFFPFYSYRQANQAGGCCPSWLSSQLELQRGHHEERPRILRVIACSANSGDDLELVHYRLEVGKWIEQDAVILSQELPGLPHSTIQGKFESEVIFWKVKQPIEACGPYAACIHITIAHAEAVPCRFWLFEHTMFVWNHLLNFLVVRCLEIS